MTFTEDNYEKALIALFDNLGYQYLYGPNVERDYYTPFYKVVLCIFAIFVKCGFTKVQNSSNPFQCLQNWKGLEGF